MSRRQKARQDKWIRIREAARELFGRQGFEATTMRQIAERADIGLGTIYAYVDTKHGLLDLISSDDLAVALAESFACLPRPEAGLQAQLRAVFAPVFRHHGEDPAFAREIFRELTFAEDSRRPERKARFQTFVARIAALLEQAGARGELRPDIDYNTAALSLFGLHFFALTITLAERQPVTQAQALFEAWLHLQLQGMLTSTGGSL